MTIQKKSSSSVGCCGLSLVTIIGIIFFIIRVFNAWTISSEQNASATAEAACPYIVAVSLDPSSYIDKNICIRGPIINIQSSPIYTITFGFQNPNTKLGTKIIATANNYTLTDVLPGMCVKVWGHLTQVSDGSLQLIIDTSKPVEIYGKDTGAPVYIEGSQSDNC